MPLTLYSLRNVESNLGKDKATMAVAWTVQPTFGCCKAQALFWASIWMTATSVQMQAKKTTSQTWKVMENNRVPHIFYRKKDLCFFYMEKHSNDIN